MSDPEYRKWLVGVIAGGQPASYTSGHSATLGERAEHCVRMADAIIAAVGGAEPAKIYMDGGAPVEVRGRGAIDFVDRLLRRGEDQFAGTVDDGTRNRRSR